MLTDVGDDDLVRIARFFHGLDDLPRAQLAVRAVQHVLGGALAALLRPCAAVCFGEAGKHGGKREFGVRHDGNVRFDVFVMLGKVDVYMYDLRLTAEVFAVARNSVVETAAYRYDEVGFRHRFRDVGFAVHADHAEIIGVRGGEAAQPHRR